MFHIFNGIIFLKHSFLAVGGEVEAVPSRVKGWWLVSGTMQFAHSPHQEEFLYTALKDLIKFKKSESKI